MWESLSWEIIGREGFCQGRCQTSAAEGGSRRGAPDGMTAGEGAPDGPWAAALAAHEK